MNSFSHRYGLRQSAGAKWGSQKYNNQPEIEDNDKEEGFVKSQYHHYIFSIEIKT